MQAVDKTNGLKDVADDPASTPSPAPVSLSLMQAAFGDAGMRLPTLAEGSLERLCDNINRALIPARKTHWLVRSYASLGPTAPPSARGKGRAERQLAGLAYLLAAKLRRTLVDAGANRTGFNETGPVAQIGARLAAAILHRGPIDPTEFAAWVRSGKRIALRAARQAKQV